MKTKLTQEKMTVESVETTASRVVISLQTDFRRKMELSAIRYEVPESRVPQINRAFGLRELEGLQGLDIDVSFSTRYISYDPTTGWIKGPNHKEILGISPSGAAA